MKTLMIREFGDPILRKLAKQLSIAQILAPKTQELIADIRRTLVDKKLGVALAAPQVGESVALSVIAVRPMEYRPDVEPFDLVIINPSYKGLSGKNDAWEGCVSSGAGSPGLFAKVPRYEKISAIYMDEEGKSHIEVLTGLKAQIFQHETDHLNGILFVDLVKDSKTYMTQKEYSKMMREKQNCLLAN